MQNIVWIASFPRSGNTWFRCFLASLLQKSAALDLNNLPSIHCANRKLIERSLCFSTGELTSAEINSLRPNVYRHWAEAWTSPLPLFVKVHDCCGTNKQHLQIFPSDATRAAIYLIRNPLDVCVSYAQFWGSKDYDKTADYICDSQHSHPLSHSNLFGQLHQHIGDWSTNVKSWCDNYNMPTKIVKYEDMNRAPMVTFLDIVKFLRLPFDEKEVRRSLKKCDFAELQNIEASLGFKDRPYSGNKFFRRGTINSWRDRLEAHTVDRIINAHSEEMLKYGYLKEDGTPA